MPCYEKDIALIETVQKELVDRFVIVDLILVYTYLWDPPSSDCLVQLKWPSMSTRFTILSLKFFHDLLHQKLSINFSDFFSLGTLLPDLIILHLCVNTYLLMCIDFLFLLMSSIFRIARLPITVASISNHRDFGAAICNYFNS